MSLSGGSGGGGAAGEQMKRGEHRLSLNLLLRMEDVTDEGRVKDSWGLSCVKLPPAIG